ncbi:hypothetical protein KIN20_023254 [Parelaphostrongylus tenuis]|uniref:Uncharacterized protein n=1 Tax=Parelaphostrongylus tenuis TaxID=148309 RepID=A0AAD5N6D3_PARTN|nr:hypothetical protein KIN20_023254 [Parelaphostrongylus tenuis]
MAVISFEHGHWCEFHTVICRISAGKMSYVPRKIHIKHGLQFAAKRKRRYQGLKPCLLSCFLSRLELQRENLRRFLSRGDCGVRDGDGETEKIGVEFFRYQFQIVAGSFRDPNFDHQL